MALFADWLGNGDGHAVRTPPVQTHPRGDSGLGGWHGRLLGHGLERLACLAEP